jgi:hypothetical protein
MGAFSTKGMKIYLEKKSVGTSPAAPVTVTAVTNSKPAVVSVAAADIAGFHASDLVIMAGTGMPSIDGKTFNVNSVDDTANTITLQGSDASGETAASATGTITNVEGSLVEFCLASLDRQQTPAQAISVGTTCDPSATLAGEPEAGTLAITGFEDFTSPGFIEWMKAVDDGIPRILEIELPPSATAPGVQGSIVYPSVTASGFSESYAVNAAAAFTGEMTLGTKPVYNVA